MGKYLLTLHKYLSELDKYLFTFKLVKYLLTSTNTGLGWSHFFGNIYWNWILPIGILHVWFISRERNRFQASQQNSSNNVSYFRITVCMNCAMVQKKMVLLVCHLLWHFNCRLIAIEKSFQDLFVLAILSQRILVDNFWQFHLIFAHSGIISIVKRNCKNTYIFFKKM